MNVSTMSIKLPACERCRKSKIRCDSAVPKCSACSRGGTACIIIDTSTGERYAREQLHIMQRKLEMLEAKEHDNVAVVSPADASQASPSLQRSHYVGDGSGSDMFHRVSASANTVEARAKVLEQLNKHSLRKPPPIPSHALPSFELANKLVDCYYSHAHLLHPLLPKECTRATLDRVYNSRAEHADKQDLYNVFMVSAISSVTMFRKGIIDEHPYGFYRSASRLMPHIALVGSLQAIQNLLLIARFAMYHHIECSIWDITRLCMRQCVELGLHLPPTTPLPAKDEQLRRNVFWDCYVHDRYSSGILGRPFAISDDDIEVDLPLEASEDQILLLDGHCLSQIDPTQLGNPNEASIFLFIIKLRQITARSQTRFFSPASLTLARSKTFIDAGEVLKDLQSFLNELNDCQLSAPSFFQPRSLYERPEWHQFMVEKDKLIVIRGAFARLSVSGSHLPHKLLVLCLECASKVIELYANLFRTGAITWTRSYFQILFTSGLSVIYAMSHLKISSDNTELNESLENASQVLTTCSTLLSQFVSEMPDAGRFTEVFQALSKPYASRNESHTWQVPAGVAQTSHDGVVVGDNGLSSSSGSTSGLHECRIDTNNMADPHAIDLDAFELDVRNLEDWPSFRGVWNNFVGQSIGEYAWGWQHDPNAWY